MVWYTYITPTIYIFQLIYRFVLALQQCSIRQDIRFNFGTNCPKPFPPKHGSGGISPVAAYRSEQPGAVCQGCTAPPLLRWLALDWRHRLFYFPAARRGYILQSRILSHDWERAGDWVEHQRRFTYELYQQSL